MRFEKRCGVSAAHLKRVVASVLKAEKRPMPISVLITDDRRIRAINKRFLKHDYATDVVSFDTGDIVVSAEYAKRYSRENGIAFREELARYVVHGALHLLGYDDKKEKDRKKMFARQEALLKRVL